MHKPPQRIVLIPRFTALAGTTEFVTPPLPVRVFEAADITVWRSRGLGATPPEMTVAVQQSTDMQTWNDIGFGFTFDEAEAEETQEFAFRLEWMRLRVQLTGDFPGLTAWAVGNFEFRET
jgi:hypothetical protein